MRNASRQVITIQDLSAFGGCSLAVVLPILAVMGAQTVPVPTALLSTHTGGFGEVVFRDETEFLRPTLKHYRSIGLNPCCIYSGFLGSEAQIELVKEYFDSFPQAMAVVDPVMGDDGKPYRTCTPQMCARMEELVSRADIITPNPTEAAMLLGAAYDPLPVSADEARRMLVKLSNKGPRTVVITGIKLTGGVCNIGYDAERNSFWKVPCNYIPVKYPGTGDIFTSVLVGALTAGASLPAAMDQATGFVEMAVKTTFAEGREPRQGAMVEKCLPWLVGGDTRNKFEIL
ncbi:MAG: pyridoxamine kinase [Clostridia bacterium]|nr:pyridoxamine kinase [Clostridia bacterium]